MKQGVFFGEQIPALVPCAFRLIKYRQKQIKTYNLSHKGNRDDL